MSTKLTVEFGEGYHIYRDLALQDEGCGGLFLRLDAEDLDVVKVKENPTPIVTVFLSETIQAAIVRASKKGAEK